MKIASNKVTDIVRFFKEQLQDRYEDGELETMIRYCFEEFLNVRHFDISLHKNDTVTESELLKFNFAVKDLKTEKPLQYIFGKADFYGLKLIVNEHVLIPRPETEELVNLIISDLKKNKNSLTIIDIGTGSGCIPIALKKNIPAAAVSAMDVSENALAVAAQNAALNKTEITFINDDILSPAANYNAASFDVIVSNPPYIRISEKEKMHTNVLTYEPHLALFVNDPDPLLFYNAIADFALKTLKPGGSIYFEINENLGPETQQLMERKGFKNIVLVKDMSNKNRILRGMY
ncbi:MAG: Release factor glutamine methyltransferase [Bacteroidetes bacterium]|nr:Release factor glutamine methyltransferase [Bacteroidota bacterium]